MNFWQPDKEFSKDEMAQYKHKLYISLDDDNLNHLPDETDSDYWELYLDPIVQVYYALWELLEANPRLASLVETGNRIKYDSTNKDPIKDEALTADLPELRITPVSTLPHLQNTSSTSMITKKYRIEVMTGDQRLDAGLFAIEWEIYRAMLSWITTLTALEWNNKPYVKLAKPISTNEAGLRNNLLERNITGWISVMEIEVAMYFTTADMLIVESEP